jgi:hypothetical protein
MGYGCYFRLLDEGETVMLPNKQKILRYLTSLRARLEGVDMSDKADDVNSPASDHRISATYALNEHEESVSACVPCEYQHNISSFRCSKHSTTSASRVGRVLPRVARGST